MSWSTARGERRLHRTPALGSAGAILLAVLAAAITWWQADSADGAATTAVRPGTSYTCATTGAGGAACWGQNNFGQLGNGQMVDSSAPPAVLLGPATVDVLDAGGFHACVLTGAGDVACWGRNDSGQIGDGTTNDSDTPVAVPLANGTIDALDAGTKHTCVLTTSDGVKCWGRNEYGQVGQPTLETCRVDVPCSTTPLDVSGLTSGVASVSAGGFHSCAITLAGAATCWGRDSFGQLGDGNMTNEPEPSPRPVIGLGDGVAEISTGSRHSCALRTGGGVWCWGSNTFGQLGDGQACGLACSVPVEVPGLSDAVAIRVGGFHSCALTSGGGVVCWGRNDFGQLGDGTTIHRSAPVATLTLASNVNDLRAGGFHGCAQMADSTVRCWGDNTYGQLGAQSTGQCGLAACSPSPILATALEKPTPTATPKATPTPKDPDADSDGDTIPNGADLNDDNDACTDAQELGPDEALGGQRDPHNFWDFYDPTGDSAVTVADFLAVLQRFGAVGDPGIDPNTTPAKPPAYHPRFDRGDAGGKHLWNVGPPDGSITVADIFSLLAQFGHSCI